MYQQCLRFRLTGYLCRTSHNVRRVACGIRYEGSSLLWLFFLPQTSSISEHSAGALSLNTSVGLGVQFTWAESRNFSTYTSLKREVESEYESEYEQRVAGGRDSMDPYVYDLYQAVRYVEEFGGEETA